MKRKNKSRKFLKCFCFFLVFAFVFWYFQNFSFTTVKTEILSAKIKNKVTIALLSDLHGATYGNENNRLIKRVKKNKPDIICVTGDMYTNNDSKGKTCALDLIKQLVEIAPVYFVPGEHDNNSEFISQLQSFGVHTMLYQKETVEINENSITIYGIDNVYYTDTFNLFREFDKPAEESFNILLAHIPNFEAFNWFGPDLSLCGDTHGGVVQIPVIGPLYFEGEWFPQLTSNKQYVTDKGLFSTYTGHVYVTGGLGNYPYPVRMFNRPELSVLTLEPKE